MFSIDKKVVDIDIVKNYYNQKIQEFKENGVITVRTVNNAVEAVKTKFS